MANQHAQIVDNLQVEGLNRFPDWPRIATTRMTAPRSRRNVLLIVVDQWRGDSLRFLGHPAVRTPNLDAFAADAATFRSHWCQGAPCGPARASMLTGQYVANHRVVTNGVPLDARHPTLASELRRAGYDPEIVGYTTTTPDPRHVPASDLRYTEIGSVMDGWKVSAHFDEVQYRNYFAWVSSRGGPVPKDAPTDVWLPTEGKPGPTRSPSRIPQEFSDTAWSTDRGLACLEAQGRRPWAVHLGYYRPHPPFIAPAPWHEAVDEAAIPVPVRATSVEVEAAAHPALAHYLGGLQSGKFYRRAEGLVRDLTDDEVRATRKAYYGMIAEVDAALGRVFDWLKKTGQWEETLVVFTSDHAEQLGDHRLLGKLLWFDQSYHIPLIVRDPLAPASARGKVHDRLTESVDLMPTILDWLGRDAPASCNGRSLMPFLREGAPADWREEVHFEFDLRAGYPDPSGAPMGLHYDAGGMAALRDRDWKYVHFASLPPLLYDLRNDPHELHNLAGDPAHAATLARYAQRMLDWRMRAAERTLTDLCTSASGLYDRRRRALVAAG